MTENIPPRAERSSPTLRTTAVTLFGVMAGRRRLQLALTIVLMFIGAFAELVTIGAVLPLLALATDPRSLGNIAPVRAAFQFVGADLTGNLIVPVAVLLAVAAIISAVVRLVLTWMIQKLVYGVEYDITMGAFGRLIRQPYENHVKQNSSDALSAIEKIYLVAIGIVSPLVTAVTSAGMAMFIIIFLFAIDPLTAAIASTTIGLLYVGISLVSRKLLMMISKRGAAARTQRMKLLQESLGGIRDIILDHSQPVFEHKLAGFADEMRRLQILSNFVANSPRFVVEGAGIILVAMLSIYFSQQPGGVLEALPVLGALALGAQRLLPLIQAVYLGWASYSVHAHVLQDVLNLLRTPVRPAHLLPKGEDIRPFGTAIELRAVSFTYASEELALKDINLTIRKGERVGLIGRTGSGKRTLVDLLMGLLRPTRGQMLLSGEPMDDRNIGNWRAQIAHVPQSIFLSDDTIAANIAFGYHANEVDLERVREAARGADVLSFLEQLPDGLMTKVGERGIRLSGGQRQRIGIARALYKQATVLILDEATSALDDATEAAVMKSLEGLDRQLTVIVIAHRLSTVAICDTIYRLEAGRIVQSGSYQEVVLGEASLDKETGSPP